MMPMPPVTSRESPDPDGSEMPDNRRVHEFIRLFTAHEARLRAFAFSLIPHWADAEEVLQEGNLVMFRKFGQFELGSNFFSWSCRIIHLEAMEFRKRQAREKVRFGDELLSMMEKETIDLETDLAERERLLGGCISQLKERQREILQMRYGKEMTVQEVAAAVGATTQAVYKTLERLYRALFDCVERRMEARGLDIRRS